MNAKWPKAWDLVSGTAIKSERDFASGGSGTVNQRRLCQALNVFSSFANCRFQSDRAEPYHDRASVCPGVGVTWPVYHPGSFGAHLAGSHSSDWKILIRFRAFRHGIGPRAPAPNKSSIFHPSTPNGTTACRRPVGQRARPRCSRSPPVSVVVAVLRWRSATYNIFTGCAVENNRENRTNLAVKKAKGTRAMLLAFKPGVIIVRLRQGPVTGGSR
ncbi:hypothetical protein BO83DRAFT_403813 [Aspergillus eucalypticola CBS 122712]|uniref:Uncharacterized protein n=1 Tax=Aspergillus eucalypticola (strain CBS 122712 / IBT 29274) TaxID=1448314 RepID=A0A317UMA9_ASPEC|nr:uncharacterized protein BO83DRAFT_403813 [Aspergillus eucalypticola CBS 122712]PWY62539.1 hypothetical protein BO83DRAFT_403813 [Aspergillus eucalypticola CBS 122712]